MLNKESEQTNRAIDFVTFYGEYAAGCNERFIEWDVKKVLEEGWTNEYIGLKKEDLPEVLDIFNEEFIQTLLDPQIVTSVSGLLNGNETFYLMNIHY